MRDGADLIHELPITFSQAALGAEIEVPTVEGTARVSIPAGTQPGRLLRLKGKGLPRLRGGGRGDLIVRIHVWVPTELNAEQAALIKRLAEIEDPPPSASAAAERERGIWSRIREAFTA